MSLRNPRYTGSNRCWPCTAVNVGLLVVVAATVAALAGAVPAAVALILGSVAIAVRGYLVPGTPRLTRTLPDPVLTRFGKHGDPTRELPVTESLVAAAVLGEDLSLPSSVESTVSAAAREYVADREALEAAVPTAFPPVTEVSVRRALGGAENWFAFDDEGTTRHQWPGRPLAALDVAAAERLTTALPDWADRSTAERATMLSLVRREIDTCPECGDAYVEPDGPRVTCCGGRSLVGARRCETCGYALFDQNDLPDVGAES